MTKVYYKRVRSAALPALALVFATSSASQQAPATMKTSALDAHEGMTIGVEPWVSAEKYKPKFPKKSPWDAGVVALHVTFRNDTNDSIRIAISKIRLTLQMDEDNRQELRPMTSEDVADAILKPGGKDPTTKKKLPLPLPGGSTGGRDKKWDELRIQAEDAGVRNGVIAPHSSTDGLLYFNLRGETNLLKNAQLYIPDLLALESNRALLYFDIELGDSATP